MQSKAKAGLQAIFIAIIWADAIGTSEQFVSTKGAVAQLPVAGDVLGLVSKLMEEAEKSECKILNAEMIAVLLTGVLAMIDYWYRTFPSERHKFLA